MRRWWLLASHAAALAIGFGAGIYLLPIISAPPAPSSAELAAARSAVLFNADFKRDVAGSDALHWGEGQVTLSRSHVAFDGALAPGPAYRLYLVPEFVDTKAGFERVKARSLAVGDIRTFDRFVLPLPPGVDLGAYKAVLVWCEAFSMFITAAPYR